MQYTLNVSVKISQHGRPTPDSFALGHYIKIFTVHVAVINVIHATVKKKKHSMSATATDRRLLKV